MNYMIAILPKMAGFLLLVLIGFTASRIGVIKKEAMPSISGFLLKIVLPALTISLIWENQTTFYTMARYGKMVIAQILMYFIMAAGGIDDLTDHFKQNICFWIHGFSSYRKESTECIYRFCMI